MNKKRIKEKTILEVIKEQPQLKAPLEVWRFFQDKPDIYISHDQISFHSTGDYGSVKEIRTALEWYVTQLGGTVKWD